MHVTEMLKAHSDSARYRACPQRMSVRYRTASYERYRTIPNNLADACVSVERDNNGK